MSNAIIADIIIDLNTGDSNGTTVTPTILGNGTQGLDGTWTVTGTQLTIESTGGSGTDRLAQVILNGSGTSFATNSTHRRLRYNPAASESYVQSTIASSGAGSRHALTLAGWITFGINDPGPGGVSPLDILRIDNVSGDIAILQFWPNDGPSGAGYSVLLHYTNTSGVIASTSAFTITPGSQHWCSLSYDSVGGTADLYLYDSAGTLETHLTASMNLANKTAITSFRLGNAEAGTGTGTGLDFENFVVDWTKAPSVIPPTGAASYWIVKYDTGGGAHPAGTGSATTITAQVPNVAAGDLAVVMGKWEGGAGSSISCSDGTSSLTASTVSSTTGQANTSGDPRLAVFYLLSSVATGTVTYTLTIGASRTFRDMAVIVVTRPSGTSAATLDGTNTGNTASSGTALTSNNQTTTGTNGMSFGGYAEFGASLSKPLVNSVREDGFRISSVGNSAAWCCAYSAGFTGAATGTLSATNNWNAQIISFNATSSAETITLDKWMNTMPAMVRRKIGVVPSGTVGIKSS